MKNWSGERHTLHIDIIKFCVFDLFPTLMTDWLHKLSSVFYFKFHYVQLVFLPLVTNVFDFCWPCLCWWCCLMSFYLWLTWALYNWVGAIHCSCLVSGNMVVILHSSLTEFTKLTTPISCAGTVTVSVWHKLGFIYFILVAATSRFCTNVCQGVALWQLSAWKFQGQHL